MQQRHNATKRVYKQRLGLQKRDTGVTKTRHNNTTHKGMQVLITVKIRGQLLYFFQSAKWVGLEEFSLTE